MSRSDAVRDSCPVRSLPGSVVARLVIGGEAAHAETGSLYHDQPVSGFQNERARLLISPFRKLVPIILVLLSSGAAVAVPTGAQAQDQVPARDAGEPVVFKNALRAAAGKGAVFAFYERNNWQTVWTDAASRELDNSLAERARHGLDRLSFLNRSAISDPAALEAARTRAALRYASALARGESDAANRNDADAVSLPDVDLSGPLADAIASGRISTWFDSLAPQDSDYKRLSTEYLDVRKEIGSVVRPMIGDGVIRVGDSDVRVPLIVNRLTGGQYLAPQTNVGGRYDSLYPGSTKIYTQEIANAVTNLQRDYGIAADGVVGSATLEVLNLRPGDRARALAVALERLRWLTREPPALRIDVNTAAAQLSYFRDGIMVDSRRAIVGRPGTETPQLLSPIYRLVANPTWTIPKSIQHGEMAGVSRSYLRRKNMVRRNGWIVQQSGPGNALGLVKFDMLNNMAIYLHDTSARSLFDRSKRHLSHGCVRVEDALGFAQLIAEDEGISSVWEAARAGRRQKFVALPQHIPVRMIYQNVFVEADRAIAYRTDPYGWNPPVARALGFEDGSAMRFRAEEVDIAP